MKSNVEIRKETNEKFKPVRKKLYLYTFVYLIICSAILLIPKIGTNIGAFICTFLTVGLLAVCLNVFNGNGEGENAISFIKHAVKNCGKLFCSWLWILLRCWPGILVIGFGFLLRFASGYPNFELTHLVPTDIEHGFSNLISFISFIIIVIGIAVTIYLEIQYSTITYEIIHNNDNLKSKALVTKAKEHLKGNVDQWFGMGLYYFLLMTVISFVLAFGVTYLFYRSYFLLYAVVERPEPIGEYFNTYTGYLFEPNKYIEAGSSQFEIVKRAAEIFEIYFVFIVTTFVFAIRFLPRMFCSFETFYKELDS